MLNAEQVIDYIHASRATGVKRGLANTRRLLEALRVGYSRPTVHVAGTNGKGSVCAMLESVLRCAGLRTGLYTSPFLQAYQERVRLDGVPLSDALLEAYGNPLIDVSRELSEREDIHPTPFEHGTALAMSVFEGENVDVAVMEVGLGGRVDPTNVLTPAVCAITAIGLDHMHILGDTLPAIAREKAGIIKPGVPVVCQCAGEDVAQVFEEAAAAVHAPLRQLREDMLLHASCDAHGSCASYRLREHWEDVRLSLPREHQLQNARTVLGVVEELRALGMRIPQSAVREGLAHTVWPARLEWCGDILLDGAHNAHGVEALRTFVTRHLQDQPRVLLTGVLSEKLSDDMLHALRALADIAVTVTPGSHRAMEADAYASYLRTLGMRVQAASSVEEGIDMARAVQRTQGGVIIACGSLYFAGEVRTALGLRWR